MWTGPPLRKHTSKNGRLVTFQLHYTALGEEAAERIRARGREKPNGGLNNPLWRADMELDLHAVPGQTIFEDWDALKSVRTFDIPEGRHVLGADFGATLKSRTAFVACIKTPRYVLCYCEYVGGDKARANFPARVHKERLRQVLMERRPDLNGSAWEWCDRFDAVGDVTGVGFKTEYDDEPDRLMIAIPGNEKGWRERDGNESLLNSLFSEAKRCCFKTWPDDEEKCPLCHHLLEVDTGFLLHPSCSVLQLQIPGWVKDDSGQHQREIEHDLLDSLLYAVRYMYESGSPIVKRVPLEGEGRPWYAGKKKPEMELGETMAYDSELQGLWNGQDMPAEYWK